MRLCCAKWRIPLVNGERHEIKVLRVVIRLNVDPPMRRELRRVDKNARADAMRLPRETMDGLDEAGDVGSSTD